MSFSWTPQKEIVFLKALFFCKSVWLENPQGEFGACSSSQLPWRNLVTGKYRNQIGTMMMENLATTFPAPQQVCRLNPCRRLLWEAGTKVLLLGLLIEHQCSSCLFQTGDSGTGKCARGRKDAQRQVLQSIFNYFFTAEYCISWEKTKTVNRWLPSAVSQLGGTKWNNPTSSANKQKELLFTHWHSSNIGSLLWDLWGQNINVVFRK